MPKSLRVRVYDNGRFVSFGEIVDTSGPSPPAKYNVKVGDKVIQKKGNELQWKKADKMYVPKADSKICTVRRFRHNEYSRTSAKVVPTVFRGGNEYGDFLWMCKSKVYNTNSVFLFTDNVYQWVKRQQNPMLPMPPGGGSGAMRKYSHLYQDGVETHGKIRSYPTGAPSLKHVFMQERFEDGLCMPFFDAPSITMEQIIKLETLYFILDMASREIETIYFPADETGNLGVAIFAHCTGKDVIDLITKEIKSLPQKLRDFRQGRLTKISLLNEINSLR